MPAEEKEEFELIPVTPLRRMEKRIEQLEAMKTFNTKEFYKELVDIIRMNQQIVDELTKANDALRIELSRLPSRMEELISKLDELISFIKASATEEVSAPADLGPLTNKLDQLIESNKKIVEINQEMITTLDEISKRLRRPILPRRTLLPTKPKL